MLRKAKYDYNRNIKLEDRKMITKDSEIAEVFNNVFANNRKFRNLHCNLNHTQSNAILKKQLLFAIKLNLERSLLQMLASRSDN